MNPEDRRDADILADLEAVLRDRKDRPPEQSYSVTLLADPERASRKVIEEAYELCLELVRPDPDPDRITSEAADVLFHVLAGLVGAGVPVAAVLDELKRRRNTALRNEAEGGA